MSPALTLLLLRALSAALLLTFIGLVGWFIYRDMQLLQQSLTSQQRQRGQLLRLKADESAEADEAFPLLPVTSLGRAVSNVVVLDDDYASSEHALLTLRGQQWWLEDLGSRNGTLLNETLLDGPAVVTTGDIVTIGDTKLKIIIE